MAKKEKKRKGPCTAFEELLGLEYAEDFKDTDKNKLAKQKTTLNNAELHLQYYRYPEEMKLELAQEYLLKGRTKSCLLSFLLS
jgi:hypothetical protein